MMRPADNDKDLGAVALQACLRARVTSDEAERRAAGRRRLWGLLWLGVVVAIVADLAGVF